MSVTNRQRGKAGRPLSVYTNSFAVTSLPRKIFYQYDGTALLLFRVFHHAQHGTLPRRSPVSP